MATLLRLIGRRLLAFPIMVLGVTFLVFVIMSFSPADPARLALGEAASTEALEAYRVEHGLNDPLLLRYVRFLGGLVQGDLGISTGNVPVTRFIAEAFPITLQLTFLGLVIAVTLATVLGVAAALFRDRWPDQLIRVLSIASLATPSFWLTTSAPELSVSRVVVIAAARSCGVFDSVGRWRTRPGCSRLSRRSSACSCWSPRALTRSSIGSRGSSTRSARPSSTSSWRTTANSHADAVRRSLALMTSRASSPRRSMHRT